MSFRYSHTARTRLMDRKNKRRSGYLYAALVAAVLILLAFAAWITLYEHQARSVAYWLLDRPVPVASSGYERTAAWKSGQEAFHALDSALYGAFLNLQITPERIRDTLSRAPAAGGRWTPVERHVTVSGAYSIAECNLEIARSVARMGGAVVRAEERTRSRVLLLDIAYDGMVTHRLNVTRDPDLRRKKGRLAVVIACTDRNHLAVAEGLSEFTRPVTLALLPWASGVDGIAAEAARGGHEVIALLPVQPGSFSGNISPNRSVLAAHSEPTNRRIVEDALASLPEARGVLRYPVGPMDGKGGVPAPVLDELGKRDMYFLDNPGAAGPSDARNDGDGGRGRLRVWGALDSVYNPVVISMNLDRASLSALDDTRAVVVADARPHTLQVLMNRMADLELRGIEFVRVSDLVDN